jgi:hypothetical protein
VPLPYCGGEEEAARGEDAAEETPRSLIGVLDGVFVGDFFGGIEGGEGRCEATWLSPKQVLYRR